MIICLSETYFNFVETFHFRVIEYIFSEVDKHIEADDLTSEFKLNALPSLCEQFVELIKYLVKFGHPYEIGIIVCDI